MPDINDLRQQRARANEQAQALAALEAAGEELTAEQVAAFATHQADFERLTAQITRMETAERMAAQTAKPLGNKGSGYGYEVLPKEPAAKGAKVARMIKAIGAVGGGGREAAHYAEQVLGDADVAMALNTGTASAGGVLVPQHFMGEIIELLRPASVVRSMQPTLLPMPNGNLTIPKMAGGATSAYIGENTDIPATEQQFGDLQLSAKNLATLVPVSNQLLNYAGITPAIESVITGDMVSSMAAREDLAFLRGNGSGNTPKGLRSIAPTAHVLIASDGATVQKVQTDLSKLELLLMNAHVRMIRPGFIMSPRTYLFLLDLVDGNGNKVFPEMGAGQLRGKPVKYTTQIPSNLGSGTESEIYLVDFADAVIGDAEQTTIAISTEAAYIDPSSGALVSAFSRNQTLIRVIAAHDFGMRHDESVAVLTAVKWGA